MTKKSLIESEEVFKELFDNMSSGVVVYESVNNDNNFIIKDINKAGEQISKVKREEVLGKLVTAVFPGIKGLGLFTVFQRVLKTGISENLPVSQYTDKRISHWVENYVYKLPSGFIVAIYDNVTERKNAEEKLAKSKKELKKLNRELELRVTERTKELEESGEKYRNFFQQYKMLVESITDSVYALDRDWNYILVNEAAAKLVQLTVDEILNKNLLLLFPGIEETPFFKAYNSVMETKKMERILNEFTHPDGRYGVYEVSVYPITEGILCIARDITEEKEIERKLKKSEEKYRKSFNRANLYKNIFAHDINNILQNIQSSVELSSLYINNPEKLHTIKELYDIINEQVNRGKKLINNVSKITEIDETETILEKSEVHLILNRAVEYLKNSFQTRNIDIQITSPIKKLYVLVNKLLLDVFENILINAVRHNNNPNINITIDILRIEVDGKKFIKLEFKDNGIGISDFRKKVIFQKGTRKNQKSKGMGLGLSLVKKIIDSYHGKIWVEDRIKSDYKQGSNFILLIPEAP
ncbi:hypothetical protein LCGC14_2105450 [marine sediment metagenome]|uniref:histidine kinase n=1 Tax=marine sediment metagenome TaxID=412755 RepID=A0A0F9E8M5_9ZZZZ